VIGSRPPARATGRATALFANTLTTGSLIAGILAGATAQALGYRAALLLCGALSAVGCVLLASTRQPRSAADTGRDRPDTLLSRRGRGLQRREPA
jgi:SET family sugar efflux transporter-like MFS transporter